MSSDAWPTPETPPAALPRIDDLPISEQGYDQEAVRLAFDSFYRHAAQLDASLRALEAVEVFRRDADALRNDLRALRALGLGGGAPEPAWATQSYARERRDVSGVVLRLTAESALIVAVAVICGVARFSTETIVILMGAAFLIVAFSEWLAARARFIPPSVAFISESEPAPYVEAPAPAPAPAPAWTPQPALAPGEDTEADALTMVADPAEDEGDAEDAADVVDPWEQGGEEADEDEDGAEPELAERGGLFRRRRR